VPFRAVQLPARRNARRAFPTIRTNAEVISEPVPKSGVSRRKLELQRNFAQVTPRNRGVERRKENRKSYGSFRSRESAPRSVDTRSPTGPVLGTVSTSSVKVCGLSTLALHRNCLGRVNCCVGAVSCRIDKAPGGKTSTWARNGPVANRETTSQKQLNTTRLRRKEKAASDSRLRGI